jgi:serine/threonine protein kinase
VRSVRALGHALVGALDAVHAARLVHRDLKSGNVLMALDGPRLIDFGIARTVEGTALTTTGVVVGSPGYLSPGQAAGDPARIGPPRDVFALGCVLAYAATGRAPFGGGTADALLFRVVHDESRLDGVPGELREIIRRCLSKEPAGRTRRRCTRSSPRPPPPPLTRQALARP